MKKVVHLPGYKENPYQGLLMAAYRKLAWEVIDGGRQLDRVTPDAY